MRRGTLAALAAPAAAAALAAPPFSAARSRAPEPPSSEPPSSAWLALLPEGEEKRRFILDCTGCHQFDARIALSGGRARTEAEWAEAVARMLRYAGAATPFPVISADRDPGRTAAWLARHLRGVPRPRPAAAAGTRGLRATVTEFRMPEPRDLPHDVAVERSGAVVITGMFTDRMYRLDPTSGRFGDVAIPVEKANPRAVEIDSVGAWWVVLGNPGKLARYAPDSGWRTFDVGTYAHSLAVHPAGKVWFNGHFTRAPELIGAVDAATGAVERHAVPPHPSLAERPGGPIPYEIRAGPDGRVWGSELQGNRLFAFDPRTGRFDLFEMPTAHSGPRRLDVAPDGTVWIPAYAANRLVRLDPRTRRFEEIPLPVRDAAPYVVRVGRASGAVWVGTGAADALLRYDPAARRFDVVPLPSRGALVRHLAVDDARGAVWLAYGASPGIPARIARVALGAAGPGPRAGAD